jgi:hypothetical protein
MRFNCVPRYFLSALVVITLLGGGCRSSSDARSDEHVQPDSTVRTTAVTDDCGLFTRLRGHATAYYELTYDDKKKAVFSLGADVHLTSLYSVAADKACLSTLKLSELEIYGLAGDHDPDSVLAKGKLVAHLKPPSPYEAVRIHLTDSDVVGAYSVAAKYSYTVDKVDHTALQLGLLNWPDQVPHAVSLGFRNGIKKLYTSVLRSLTEAYSYHGCTATFNAAQHIANYNISVGPADNGSPPQFTSIHAYTWAGTHGSIDPTAPGSWVEIQGLPAPTNDPSPGVPTQYHVSGLEARFDGVSSTYSMAIVLKDSSDQVVDVLIGEFSGATDPDHSSTTVPLE